MADQPADCSRLPAHLLELIADKTRDAVNGVTLFRSVCPAWRAAAGEAPRLLLPVPLHSATTPPRAGSEHALVFPLARGWSIVVDVRDTSCRLSHLATGATAALPCLTAVRATAASRVVHVGYQHFDAPAAPETTEGRVPRQQRNFRAKRRFRMAVAGGGNRRRRRRSGWRVRMDPRWKKSLQPEKKYSPSPECKIQIKVHWYYMGLGSNLQFSEVIRFGVHVGAPAASTDGMLIMMYHILHGQTGLVFCRPGDAAWTKLENPVLDELSPYKSSSTLGFVDFAYFDGKMFAMDKNGVTAVFDAATFEVLDLVDAPPDTTNFSTKLFGCCADDQDPDDDMISYLHLVALPSKLLLVRVHVIRSSSEPESFDVFELGSDDDGVAWCKVIGLDGFGSGYDLFLDGHHATFHRGDHGDGRGNMIYYVHQGKFGDARAAAYRYSLQDDELECVYRPPEESDCEYSNFPSWFVP
ncbi:hypothetical protein ACP70R_048067 [Stipagrostis hirtigluma subsp. patula]